MSLSVLYLCVRSVGVRVIFLYTTERNQSRTTVFVSGQDVTDSKPHVLSRLWAEEVWRNLRCYPPFSYTWRDPPQQLRTCSTVSWFSFCPKRSEVLVPVFECVCSDNELCVWLIQRTLKSSSHSDHPDLLNDMGLDLLSSPSTTLIEGHRASLNDFDFLVLVSGFDFLILGDGLGFTGDFVNSFFLFTLLRLSSNEM